MGRVLVGRALAEAEELGFLMLRILTAGVGVDPGAKEAGGIACTFHFAWLLSFEQVLPCQ